MFKKIFSLVLVISIYICVSVALLAQNTAPVPGDFLILEDTLGNKYFLPAETMMDTAQHGIYVRVSPYTLIFTIGDSLYFVSPDSSRLKVQ